MPTSVAAMHRLLPLLLLIALTAIVIVLQLCIDDDAWSYSAENRGKYLGNGQEEADQRSKNETLIREKVRALATVDAEELTKIHPDETVEQHIERLIDLVAYAYAEEKRVDHPLSTSSVLPEGMSAESFEAAKRFYRVHLVLDRLRSYKMLAISAMARHLDDQRMSIPLHHRCFNDSIGEWCNWSIRHQLQDRPHDYAHFPYTRLGRDGQEHDRSFQTETPFDDSSMKGIFSHDALRNWLEANKSLSYPQMQIKCLTWLLEKEKAIGAPDAESYFINILPLEIQILKRRIECGEKVEAELANLERRQKEKLANEIPPELLPAKP